MNLNSIRIELSECSKFHRYLFIQGTCSIQASCIHRLTLSGTDATHANSQCTDLTESESQFELHVLRSSNSPLNETCSIHIETIEGKNHQIRLKPLLDKLHKQTPTERLKERFADLLLERDVSTLLDLGGRDRSGLDRSQRYPAQKVTVLDIHPGDNVNVVGDAHELKTLFLANSFGALVSVAVFEHLAMPWKAALGINHCLSPGGLCLIESHQSIGLHDMPWDFWRYSDRAWHVLFNQQTGFRILGTAMSEPIHLTPFHDGLESMIDAEHSAGFLLSAVLAEKTHTVDHLSWDVALKDLDLGHYPLT